MWNQGGGGERGVSWRQIVPPPPSPPLQAHRQTFDQIIQRCLFHPSCALQIQTRQMTQPWCTHTHTQFHVSSRIQMQSHTLEELGKPRCALQVLAAPACGVEDGHESNALRDDTSMRSVRYRGQAMRQDMCLAQCWIQRHFLMPHVPDTLLCKQRPDEDACSMKVSHKQTMEHLPWNLEFSCPVVCLWWAWCCAMAMQRAPGVLRSALCAKPWAQNVHGLCPVMLPNVAPARISARESVGD